MAELYACVSTYVVCCYMYVYRPILQSLATALSARIRSSGDYHRWVGSLKYTLRFHQDIDPYMLTYLTMSDHPPTLHAALPMPLSDPVATAPQV